MPRASKLVKDLQNVPSIVGALGLSIAEAQKAFNLDYLENVEQLLGMIKSLLAPEKGADGKALTADQKASVEAVSGEVIALLKQLAPSRYQFTETTLNVRMDLAQTADVGASAGFGIGTAAVAVNASLTLGFGYDYRAAAEVKTILHAIPSDPAMMDALLKRADKLSSTTLTLPERSTVDQEIVDKSHDLVQHMSGVRAAKTTAGAQQGAGAGIMVDDT